MGSLPPRTTPFSLLPPSGAQSGAQGMGHIDFRVLLDRVLARHFHLPERFVTLANAAEGESIIYLFGIGAAIRAVCVVNEHHNGSPRSCVLCIDNQAALDSLAKGPSASELGTILVGVFWSFSASGPAQWWLEYVNAKSNDADEPSRWRASQLGRNALTT